MLDDLFPQRAQAKARGDEVASQAIKILMNSFYGVMGTSACRFYNPALVNAITSQGRHLLNWSRRWFEERDYEVLYGDTDSVFVRSGIADPVKAEQVAVQVVEQFNQELQTYICDQVQAPNHLELEFEKLYTQLFLAKVRGGSKGARKRYAGLRHGYEEPEFVGLEVVRRDWTELAKRVQRDLFAHLFSANMQVADVQKYVEEIVARLRDGQFDEELVYRKGLRKEVASYTANIPPHVQAVKKSSAPAPRVVHYVMTLNGPEMVNETTAPIDREYYVQRQVLPVAEPLLETLGLSFNQVIGDDRQIDLFG